MATPTQRSLADTVAHYEAQAALAQLPDVIEAVLEIRGLALISSSRAPQVAGQQDVIVDTCDRILRALSGKPVPQPDLTLEAQTAKCAAVGHTLLPWHGIARWVCSVCGLTFADPGLVLESLPSGEPVWLRSDPCDEYHRALSARHGAGR